MSLDPRASPGEGEKKVPIRCPSRAPSELSPICAFLKMNSALGTFNVSTRGIGRVQEWALRCVVDMAVAPRQRLGVGDLVLAMGLQPYTSRPSCTRAPTAHLRHPHIAMRGHRHV